MSMKFLTNKSLLSKAKIVGKTLVVLILSVLLFNPTPVLAFDLNNFLNSIKSGDLNQTVNELQKVDLNKIDLNKVNQVVNDIRNTVNPPANVAPSLDYNKELQSYISKLKVDFNRILDSIRKLSSLPEKEGQESLATIESQLQELQNNSSSRATQFDTWSKEQQKKYEELLNNINTMYQEQQVLKREVEAKKAELPIVERELGLEGSKYDEAYNRYKEIDREVQYNLNVTRLTAGLMGLDQPLPLGFRTPEQEKIREAERKNHELIPVRDQLKSQLDRVLQLRNAVESKKSELVTKQSRIETLERNKTKLESDRQTIADGAVLATKMSSFCNMAKNEIDLAKQKLGVVKGYVDVTSSFTDPDTLAETRELDEMLAKLTNKLSNVS